MKNILLITGATGAQGGATIRALQSQPDSNWHIRAIVRNPNGQRAKALSAKGVEVVKGNLDDETSVRAAMIGAYGVFSVQTIESGPDAEERQGGIVSKAAAEAAVRHFIYSSVGGAERTSGVPHFESKFRIERQINALGLPATIFRPAAFMDNFTSLPLRLMMLSLWKTYLGDIGTLQLIATADIGKFVAKAFSKPADYIDKQIEIAGDEVTCQQVIHILRQNGITPAFGFKIPALIRSKVPEEFRLMFEWFARAGYQANIADVKQRHPEMLTLHAWAAKVSR